MWGKDSGDSCEAIKGKTNGSSGGNAVFKFECKFEFKWGNGLEEAPQTAKALYTEICVYRDVPRLVGSGLYRRYRR